MKKHLRLLYGADDRFQFVSETVKFCHEYFDTVRILNTGLKEFGDNFKNLAEIVKKSEAEELSVLMKGLAASAK